jgi:hypothetical protein
VEGAEVPLVPLAARAPVDHEVAGHDDGARERQLGAEVVLQPVVVVVLLGATDDHGASSSCQHVNVVVSGRSEQWVSLKVRSQALLVHSLGQGMQEGDHDHHSETSSMLPLLLLASCSSVVGS